MEETKDLRVQNTNLANDNDVLKKRVSKLQDIESKYHTMASSVHFIVLLYYYSLNCHIRVIYTRQNKSRLM